MKLALACLQVLVAFLEHVSRLVGIPHFEADTRTLSAEMKLRVHFPEGIVKVKYYGPDADTSTPEARRDKVNSLFTSEAPSGAFELSVQDEDDRVEIRKEDLMECVKTLPASANELILFFKRAEVSAPPAAVAAEPSPPAGGKKKANFEKQGLWSQSGIQLRGKCDSFLLIHLKTAADDDDDDDPSTPLDGTYMAFNDQPESNIRLVARHMMQLANLHHAQSEAEGHPKHPRAHDVSTNYVFWTQKIKDIIRNSRTALKLLEGRDAKSMEAAISFQKKRNQSSQAVLPPTIPVASGAMLLGLRRQPPVEGGERQHRAIRVLDGALVTVPARLPAANVGGDETSDGGDLPPMDGDDDGDDDVVAEDENQEEERLADGVNEIDGPSDNLFDNANLREEQEVQVRKEATKAAAQARRASAANNATAPARGATPVIEDMTTKLVKAILSMGKVDCDSDAWNKVVGELQAAITPQSPVWYKDTANAKNVETQIIALLATLDYDSYTLQHHGVLPKDAATALGVLPKVGVFPPSRKMFLFHNGC